jgi:hypothetical protein
MDKAVEAFDHQRRTFLDKMNIGAPQYLFACTVYRERGQPARQSPADKCNAKQQCVRETTAGPRRGLEVSAVPRGICVINRFHL